VTSAAVLIAGVGMTPFRRSPGVGLRPMANAAIAEALVDADVRPEAVERIFFANAAAATITGQEMIRGQVALHKGELAGLPLINVENACASGSSALHLAWEAIAGGRCEVALVVGVEQLNHADKAKTFRALRGSADLEEIEAEAAGPETNSVLMEFYAAEAAGYLSRTGATEADLAAVAVKNRRHAAENPLAQFRKPQSVEDVLNGPMIVPPLRLAMCSPTTDGAAAVVLCSESYAKGRVEQPIRVLACELRGGRGDTTPVAEAAAAAYEAASVGPGDLDLIELHDAAAPAELIQYAEIGLCDEGQGHHLLRDGQTALGGRIPVNTSGGLMSRGHPLGATGLAQVTELAVQIRGRAGGRQVAGASRAMAINGGGWLDGTYAVTVATVLEKPH
jgi:acetyl-CoA acyltransferase